MAPNAVQAGRIVAVLLRFRRQPYKLLLGTRMVAATLFKFPQLLSSLNLLAAEASEIQRQTSPLIFRATRGF